MPGHAYSVLEVKGEGSQAGEAAESLGKDGMARLLWGRLLCQCQEVASQKLEIVSEDDGSFWMHLNDFCCYFDRTCHKLQGKSA